MPTKIPSIETLSAESQALYDAVNDERDLPCVLISTSFLGQCLGSLLERFFINSNTAKSLLDSRSGPLGTFFARADLCYSLGMIPKALYQNLRRVGEIRNRFAHSYLSLSFDDPSVVQLCEALTLPKVVGTRVEGDTGKSYQDDDPFAQFTHPRMRFTICVVLMANRLLLTGLSTERRAKQEKGRN